MAPMTASLTTREHLSIPHLIAACTFSRAVGKLERENAGEPLGEFWDDLQSNAIASIFTVVAGLEAYANELFKDAAKNFPSVQPAVIAKMWEVYETKPALDKFEFALLLLNRTAFDRGASPYQDVVALTKLRNGLIHFKPESSDEKIEHAKLSKALEHRAVRSPYWQPPELLFPRAWSSHGTTKWAFESTAGFMTKFAQLSGLDDRLSLFADKLKAD